MVEPEFIVPPPGLLPEVERPRAEERAPDATTRLGALNQSLGRAPIAVPGGVPVPVVPPAARVATPPAAAPVAPPAAGQAAPAPVAPPAAAPAPAASAPVAPVAPSAFARPPVPDVGSSHPPAVVVAPAAVTAPTPVITDATPAPVAPGPVATWRLRTSVGGEVVVTGRVVLGRAPTADGFGPGAVAVPLHDPARTVSKVHAVVEPGDGVLVVVDQNSTNGVRIRRPGGEVVDLAAGAPARVEAGSVLELGQFELAVEGPTAAAR